MRPLVVDASAAVEYLLRTRVGRAARDVFRAASLLAPELLDAEVLATLRRASMAGRLSPERAREALEDLAFWPVFRVRHAELLTDAWALRHNVSGYDAFYVAVARRYHAALVTADAPLSRAPGLGVVVHNLRA